ncbi:dynein axonemal assembly factor 6 [Amia ocellicauda]|uniref:dynein axonemal assembly factor 6 n=1 Tax=Amia ocellicauda TaxID=2972642 RepID=UPI003463DDD8|nr:PIHD3 protein [Amia calva]
MEGLSSLDTLQALSTLLSPSPESDDEDSSSVQSTARMGPGQIGPARAQQKKVPPVPPVPPKNSKEIWSAEEVAEGSQFDDIMDPRPQPEYEVMLQQSVGTEDVFLGMSRKNPSSACCERILVRIKLPDTKMADVVLDVRETFLDLRAPNYKLGLHLPHPVHSEEGRARFVSERGELEVSLPTKRPLDCINLA